MKIRSGFVANSSSSSFICEICGEGDVYHDSIGIDEIEMCYCVNEHLFCQKHIIDNDSYNVYEVPEHACPICTFQEYSQPELCVYLNKEYGIGKDIVLAEIKKTNKRRRKVYNNEYIEYVLKQNNLTDDAILDMLKEKFGSYQNFKQYIKD